MPTLTEHVSLCTFPDVQTFCGALGSVDSLPSQVDIERQVLSQRLRRAEVRICHSLTQERRNRAGASKNGKPGNNESPRSYTNIATLSTSEPRNAEQEQEDEKPHDYIEMSPPPTGSKDTGANAHPENGHRHTAKDSCEEVDGNKQSGSRDSLELLEEDEEESACQQSPAPPQLQDQDSPITPAGESSEPCSPQTGTDRPMQKRMSVSVLRRWKGFRDKVSGGSKRRSEVFGRERLGSRSDKKKLPMENIRNPEMCGYLRKRDKRIGRWQRRWCLVKGDRLLYAEKETDKFTSDAFSMKGYTVGTGKHSTYRMQHVIELVHDVLPSYQFAASSKEDMDNWLTILQRAAGLAGDGYEIPIEFDPDVLAQLQHDQEQAGATKEHATPPPLPGEDVVSPKVYRAIFDFDGGEEDELPFKKGDLLLIEDGGNEHWLIGTLQTNDQEEVTELKGFVPKPYLQPVTDDNADH